MDVPEEGRNCILKSELVNGNGIKYGKYVKTICWSPPEPIAASVSVDCTVKLTSIKNLDNEDVTIPLKVVQSIHFD